MREIKGKKIAYHFLKDDMCGGYGNEPAWKIGETREFKGELIMCQQGYHAGPSLYDALGYAKGNVACIVEIENYLKDTDKFVAHKRTLIKAVNAEKVLREWGCDCAERALEKAKVEDKRSWGAIEAARLYNEDKATKEELAAARDAAVAAARDAAGTARDAAGTAGAAGAAAWAAAGDAAGTAAGDAAGTAAWAAVAAARDAAGTAEIKWQKRHLNKLMKKSFGM